jgi:hypothetical protein
MSTAAASVSSCSTAVPQRDSNPQKSKKEREKSRWIVGGVDWHTHATLSFTTAARAKILKKLYS